MNISDDREFGEQPISAIMAAYELKPHDLVKNSTEQISHKMVAKAMRGRRLSRHVQFKILAALKKATKKDYLLRDLFNY